jgi:hypothetical protein
MAVRPGRWVLLRSAAAQQQIFHAVHFIEFGRVHVPVKDDNLQVPCI